MPRNPVKLLSVPELVRGAGLEAANHAYEEAGVRGLCAEGRWEAAVSAVRTPGRSLRDRESYEPGTHLDAACWATDSARVVVLRAAAGRSS